MLHGVYFLLMLVKLYLEVSSGCTVARASGKRLAYCQDSWNFVSLAVLLLQVVAWFFFFSWVLTSRAFSPRWRYDVYDVNDELDAAGEAWSLGVVRVGGSAWFGNSTSTATTIADAIPAS